MARVHHWWNEPPWWAWAVIAAGLLVLGVGTPLALQRGQAPAEAGEPAAQTTAEPTTAPLTVAFLGDSYVAGSGIEPQDAERQRWPAVTCAQVGCTEQNFGFGGTGYTTAGPLSGGTTFAERIADVAGSAPAVVVVSGGRNDMSATADDFQAAAADTFRQLRDALPDARIVALQPLWDASPYPDQLNEMGTAIQQAAESVGGTYVPVPNPLDGQSDLISADEIHPNADGHRVLGVTIADALRGAGVV